MSGIPQAFQPEQQRPQVLRQHVLSDVEQPRRLARVEMPRPRPVEIQCVTEDRPAAAVAYPWPQKALAELVDLSLIQIHRYEAGSAQPTLDGIRKLARALRVPADSLVFEQDERGPDEEFRLQFEAFTAFDKDEKKAAKTLLDALILKHQARRWASAS